MNKPCHFVGFWGSQKMVTIPIIKKKAYKVKQGKANLSEWGLAFLGDFEEKTENKDLIAFISASGLSNLKDAWVKIENDCLILGRDAFGRVPLYWMQQEEIIWFASQFQLLLPLVSTRQVNLLGLYGYTCFSYIPTPLTPVEGIYAVEAGTEEVFFSVKQRTHVKLSQWRSLPKTHHSETEIIIQLQTLLKDAIVEQISDLSSDETVGVFLSGGLDSSIVAALLVQAGIKVRAYTLDFSPYGVSELEYAEHVATYLNIPLVKVSASPQKIKKALLATVRGLDIPFGDGVTVPLYLLYQAASQETGIIFNGENGDQLFAGWTNKPIIAASVYGNSTEETFIEHYLETFHRFYGYKERIFSPTVYQQLSSPKQWLEEALDPRFSECLLDRLRRATLMLKGAQNIQPRATNLAFAQGLWVRSPFCHLPLTQWTFQVPWEFFLQASCEKYILKRAVEDWLPTEIVWRQKRGMGVPLTQWCLESLWYTVGKWLNPRQLELEDRFVRDIAINVILGQLGGQIRGRRIGEILWLLLMWEVWRTEVLQEPQIEGFFYNPFWLPYRWWNREVQV